jgi:hypothetical protein
VEDWDRHDEMLMGLVYRARWDERFRKEAHENPREALARYSYYLTEAEMDAVMAFYNDVKDLSDAELNERLAGLADPITKAAPRGA